MTIEETKAAARRFYEATGDIDRQLALIAPDSIDHTLPPSTPQGLESIRQHAGGFYDAFPDLTITIEDMVCEDENVATRYTVRGTHLGGSLGMAPTGKTITMTGIGMDRFVDGKLVEHRSILDRLGMLQQLGVIPPPT